MTDLEKGHRRQRQDKNHDEDAAAAKLWAVYVSEAEKYDRSLVETWKSDMEGLLIFAALFSAILTAFIVESYKSLNPDPSDLTVHLLGQISQQLAAAANGSTFSIPPSLRFTPTASSLVCNALWFISLGFSLACALIATLIQQWARDFLHKADMRSAPIIRARIFSYLYYGLKRFQMHTVVEVIPLLLHASLLLFFGGLVAFLIPVNILMTVIAATVLAIVTAAYSVLTILPLRYLDCPYQTPLSGTFWRILQNFKKTWCQRRISGPETVIEPYSDDESHGILFTDETMVEAMSRTAMHSSDERFERDSKALVWTVKSLTDNVELEPFVEAIPDLLWGPTARRTSYDRHIHCLLRNPDLRLLDRIGSLLLSCDAGILAPDASQRRQIACFKALWALASLLHSTLDEASNDLLPGVEVDFIGHIPPGSFRWQSLTASVTPYMTSAHALMALSAFRVFQSQLIELRDYLVTCGLDLDTNLTDSPGLIEVTNAWSTIQYQLSTFGIGFWWGPHCPWTEWAHSGGSYRTYVDESKTGVWPATSRHLQLMIELYLENIPALINFIFLSRAASSEFPPYHLNITYSALRQQRTLRMFVFDPFQELVHTEIDKIIPDQLERLNTATDITTTEWIDTLLSELLSFWQPTAVSRNPARIPRALIVLLNGRESDRGLEKVLRSDPEREHDRIDTELRLWNCFPQTLLDGAFHVEPTPFNGVSPHPPLSREDLFTALWRLAYLFHRRNPSRSSAIRAVLKAVLQTESSSAHFSFSIIALLKMEILCSEMEIKSAQSVVSGVNHYLFPTETAAQIPREMEQYSEMTESQQSAVYWFKRNRICEATLDTVAEYLERCTSDVLPFNFVKTFDRIYRAVPIPCGPIHSIHQMRLANSIKSIVAIENFPVEVLNGIVDSAFWGPYKFAPNTPAAVEEWMEAYREERANNLGSTRVYPWLDNPVARQQVKEAFSDYEKKLILSGASPNHLVQLQRVLRGFDLWHPEADSSEPRRKQHGERTGPDSDMTDSDAQKYTGQNSSTTQTAT
ncbi:hypothetical protein DFH06DRAFT_1473046 [Mycena polygramma]|nr:hypothetical protein DFH06DRAFT_1473046 [Mycena polygramma]